MVGKQKDVCLPYPALWFSRMKPQMLAFLWPGKRLRAIKMVASAANPFFAVSPLVWRPGYPQAPARGGDLRWIWKGFKGAALSKKSI
jgi:hypothetical protein